MKHLKTFFSPCSPYVSFTNVVLLFFFGFCFCQIHGLVEEQHIISVTKAYALLQQQGAYRLLLQGLSIFNAWLVFWPMIRFIYQYYYVLKIEIEQLCFDLLLLFVSLLFSIVIVFGFTLINAYLLYLTGHVLEIAGPDVNIWIELKNLILQGVFEFGCAPQNCVTCDPGSSSSPNTPGSLDSGQQN
jgi:hypothetical protein